MLMELLLIAHQITPINLFRQCAISLTIKSTIPNKILFMILSSRYLRIGIMDPFLHIFIKIIA